MKAPDAAAEAQYRAAMEAGAVADLGGRVLLGLRGADRVRFLNGQVTSDVKALGEWTSQPACLTNAKGRLCAEVRITAVPEAFHLDAEAGLADALQARLERYMVADDVALALLEGMALLHVVGPKARDLNAEWLPGGVHAVTARRFGIDGWDVWLDTARAGEVLARARSASVLLDEEVLEAIRVERGVPRWGFELGEDTLPPEAGLDRTHIDYHKGCYVGQEVISRIRSVGHVNRSLVGFAADDGQLLPGMTLWSPAQPDRPVGSVTSVAWSFALEKPVGLGYLRRGTPVDGLTARLEGSPPLSVHLRELPQPSP